MGTSSAIEAPNNASHQSSLENDSSTSYLTRITRTLEKVRGIGLFFALLSGIMFAMSSFLVDIMSEVNPAFLVTSQSTIQFLVVLPILIKSKNPLFGVDGERLILAQRALFGFITFLISYTALRFASLSDSSSILFSASVFVSIFGCVLLKEPCGLFQYITILVTLIGVFLISRPSFLFSPDVEDVFTPESRWIGIGLSLVACLAMSYTYINIRRLKRTPTTSVIAFFSLFCVFAGSICMNAWSFFTHSVLDYPLSGSDWVKTLCHGLVGVLAQGFLVLSLKLEEASLVSLMRTFDIVMAFGLQAIFFPVHVIYWTSILGAVIICSTCIAVGVKRYLHSRKNKLTNV